ncbi:MAG TPA: response regulator [Blastocatellia bacterium]|nr:response regulator [Blastocatellia bacterium]
MSSKILVVEDHADARDMLEALLTDQGYTVFVAEDGLEGLELMEVAQPDFIITDIEMPNLDGVGFIKEVREHKEWRSIPVVVLSAYGSGNLLEALKAGANWTMRKPFEFDSLARLIKDMLMTGLIFSLMAGWLL